MKQPYESLAGKLAELSKLQAECSECGRQRLIHIDLKYCDSSRELQGKFK